MSGGARMPPQMVPVLTEVVHSPHEPVPTDVLVLFEVVDGPAAPAPQAATPPSNLLAPHQIALSSIPRSGVLGAQETVPSSFAALAAALAAPPRVEPNTSLPAWPPAPLQASPAFEAVPAPGNPPMEEPWMAPPTPPAAATSPAAPAPESAPQGLAVQDAEEIVQVVLAALQKQIDQLLEYRVKEVLAPALARVSDALLHEIREDLAVTLTDVVSRAVTQEIVRRRPKP